VGSGAVLKRRGTRGTPRTWGNTTRAPTRRFPCRWWHRPNAPRGNVRLLSYAEMSPSTRQDHFAGSTTRGGACRGASRSRIEARGQGLEQSPMPEGTRSRGACTGGAIVNRRSASGGGILIRPGTRHLDIRGVSILPAIGHRPGETQPNLALRGAARTASHKEEEDQQGSLRGELAHRHHPQEGPVAFLPCCSPKCDNTLSPPHPVGGEGKPNRVAG